MIVSRFEEDFQLLKLVFLGELESRMAALRGIAVPKPAAATAEPRTRA
jgi:hypothetical protein